MRQRKYAIVSDRSTILQEIEIKRVIKKMAFDLEKSLILQEFHAKNEVTMLQIRNEWMQFKKHLLNCSSILSSSLPSCPLLYFPTIPRTLSNIERKTQPNFIKKASKVSTVAYIEENDGICMVLLAQVTSCPAMEDQCFVLNGLSQ
jgi:hypothetical protein